MRYPWASIFDVREGSSSGWPGGASRHAAELSTRNGGRCKALRNPLKMEHMAVWGIQMHMLGWNTQPWCVQGPPHALHGRVGSRAEYVGAVSRQRPPWYLEDASVGSKVLGSIGNECSHGPQCFECNTLRFAFSKLGTRFLPTSFLVARQWSFQLCWFRASGSKVLGGGNFEPCPHGLWIPAVGALAKSGEVPPSTFWIVPLNPGVWAIEHAIECLKPNHVPGWRREFWELCISPGWSSWLDLATWNMERPTGWKSCCAAITCVCPECLVW